VFVGGELVGGSTDVLEAWKQGKLQKLLANARVEFDKSTSVDPFSFLPTWLQKR
jgi:cysteine synthase A